MNCLRRFLDHLLRDVSLQPDECAVIEIFERSGYAIEEIDEDQLDLDFGSDAGEADDDYTDDLTDEGEEDFEI